MLYRLYVFTDYTKYIDYTEYIDNTDIYFVLFYIYDFYLI